MKIKIVGKGKKRKRVKHDNHIAVFIIPFQLFEILINRCFR